MVLVSSLLLASCINGVAYKRPLSNTTSSAAKATIPTLNDLSIERLRQRTYGSELTILERPANASSKSMLASYDSDGLRLYTRIDVPNTPAPVRGFPVVVFIHGWRGIEKAPSLNFYYDPESYYHDLIEGYIEAGFVVFTPGLRGHGTINGKPADGIEYLANWDNGSYLSPIFYAIDVLNLLDSLDSFNDALLNRDSVNLSAHSQGGDAALLSLAVAGENSRLKQSINAASIWAGCIAPRLTQLETYAPMQQSLQAFMSGDGSWNGTAKGVNEKVNPHFIFPYPADYIATMDTRQWTWQKDAWTDTPVSQVLSEKTAEMYYSINQYVNDIDDAAFKIYADKSQRTRIKHDARVLAAMEKIDAFNRPDLLTEKLVLHHSDQDFYSLPAWNDVLCQRVNESGGHCKDYTYKENTHSLRLSEHKWFSSEQAIEGFSAALARDRQLFSPSP